MLLEIIKTELTSLLSWYRGAMYRSPDPSQITKLAYNFLQRALSSFLNTVMVLACFSTFNMI